MFVAKYTHNNSNNHFFYLLACYFCPLLFACVRIYYAHKEQDLKVYLGTPVFLNNFINFFIS